MNSEFPGQGIHSLPPPSHHKPPHRKRKPKPPASLSKLHRPLTRFYCNDCCKKFRSRILANRNNNAVQHYCSLYSKIITRKVDAHSNKCKGDHGMGPCVVKRTDTDPDSDGEDETKAAYYADKGKKPRSTKRKNGGTYSKKRKHADDVHDNNNQTVKRQRLDINQGPPPPEYISYPPPPYGSHGYYNNNGYTQPMNGNNNHYPPYQTYGNLPPPPPTTIHHSPNTMDLPPPPIEYHNDDNMPPPPDMQRTGSEDSTRSQSNPPMPVPSFDGAATDNHNDNISMRINTPMPPPPDLEPLEIEKKDNEKTNNEKKNEEVIITKGGDINVIDNNSSSLSPISNGKNEVLAISTKQDNNNNKGDEQKDLEEDDDDEECINEDDINEETDDDDMPELNVPLSPGSNNNNESFDIDYNSKMDGEGNPVEDDDDLVLTIPQ